MNTVNLIGNLTRDPEIRYTSGAEPMAIATFTLAINRAKDGADFPRVKCFGRTAENCERYLSKGRKVAVTGRIQTGSYEKDGRKVYTTDVVAERVEFLNGVDQSGADTGREEIADPRGQFAQLDDDVPW